MWILCNLCLVVSFTASTDGQNNVRKPSSITKGPETKVIFREHQAVTLTCKAEGLPAVITYAWKRNGEYLNLNHPNIHRVSDGDITIVNATREDDGFYQCFATNQYGTTLSTVAHIQMAFLHRTSQSNIIVNKTVPEGRPFVISAVSRNSLPMPMYSWNIVTNSVDPNPRKFDQSPRVHSLCNGDLYFAYALKEDELGGSIYKSTAFNAYADVTLGGSYTRVMLTQDSGDPSDISPNITYFSKSQEVALIGGNIELKCFFSGKPLPNITWSRPRNNLPSGRNNISHYATKLTISNISKSDEGDYVCTATNTIGTIDQTLNIRVEAVPIFKRESDGPRNVIVTEGDNVTFNCSAFAIPNATVVWLQNGQPIDVTKAPERIVFSSDRKSLTIRDVCRDCVDRESKTDLMVIQCNASNVHGYAFAQGYLNILLRTKVTLLPNSTSVSVDLTKENRFQFICSAASDPSTPPTVWWYKVLDQGQGVVYSEPPYVNVTQGNLTIYTEPDCSTTCDKYLAEYRCVGDNGYTRDTATVILYDAKEKYCDYELDKEHSILWKHTSAGKEISHPCPGNTIGTCSRKCLLGKNAKASWSPPNYNGCFDKEFGELLDTVNNLSADALQNQTVMAEIASQLSALTNKSEGLSPGNLNASVMIINRLVDLRRGSKYTPNKKEIESIVQAVSNVLQPNNSKAWKELININKHLASTILHTFDIYGRSLYTLIITEHIILEKDHLCLEAWLFNTSNLSPRIEFPGRSGWGENRGDGISISTEALNSSISWKSQSTLTMYGVYYRTIHEHLPGNKDFGDVNSRILAFTIGELTTNDTLYPPVLITLRHNKEKRRSFQRTCAFWNFDRNGWDSEGCSVISTNLTHTICSCDHLTNFAILMSRNPSEDKLLSLISIIGCSISVAALILTIIVYAFTWKQAKSTQATLLLNLCVALIIAYIIFLTGADKFDRHVYSEEGCTAVAVLLHYFFLTAFFIMLAGGIDMVLYIFFVFHVRKTIETVMLVATAWVLPLIIVGISLGSTKLEGYGHDTACWLSAENGLIWAFVGPVLCIITVNCVILVVVLRLVSQKRDLLAKDRKKSDDIRATIWNLSITCPVLGLGWLFGTLSVSFDYAVFQYLFVIANSLQGLLIFIFHALFHNKKMNEKISSVYSKYICRTRKTYTQMTSSQDQSASSKAATQMTSTQDQSTSSKAATQMTSTPDQSTSSKAATQMTSAQDQSTRSKAATQMTSAQDQSTSSKAATQMTSGQDQSTSSKATTQITPGQEQSTSSAAATQMTSSPEQSTSSEVDTQMASAQDQSTNSTAAKKKSHKTGFGGVPTAFKFCEEMRSHGNFHSPGTQLLSIEDSDTFESTH